MNSRYNVVYIISSSWRGILDTTSCDKVCQWLATGRWFALGTLVFSTNKTDHHDLTEILLKVALNTIILNPQNLSKVTFQNNILPLYMKMDHACTMSGSRFSWHLIFYIFIFFARTTWPYWTKLECDTDWMVLFRNCALWHCLTFKMTAKTCHFWKIGNFHQKAWMKRSHIGSVSWVLSLPNCVSIVLGMWPFLNWV